MLTKYAGLHVGTAYNPQKAPWGTIRNNVGHSIQEGFSPCPIAGGIGGVSNSAKAWQVDGLQIYGVSLGNLIIRKAKQDR